MSIPPVIKRCIFLLLSFITITIAKAQTNSETVSIPDPNFERALIDLGIDSDGVVNQSVLRSDAEAFSGSLDVSHKNIYSLSGIGYFTSIDKLIAVGNMLTSVDISNLQSLKHLDLSGNVGVKIVNDSNSNSQLTYLNLHMCAKNSFDPTGFPKLELLFLGANNLNSLDLTGLTELSRVFLQFNNLSSIDLSRNTKLTQVVLKDNQLESLDIRNGNNEILEVLVTTGNLLECINVDGGMINRIPATWENDFTTIYSADCASEPVDRWGLVGTATPNDWVGPDAI